MSKMDTVHERWAALERIQPPVIMPFCLCTCEATSGVLYPVFGPQYRKDTAKLERGQQKVTKMPVAHKVFRD